MMTTLSLYGDEYTFGDGMQISDSPIFVGGYVSSVLESRKNSRLFDVDDAALLVYGEYDRFDFMAEFEAADLYQKELNHTHDENSSAVFHTERIYGDYFFGDNERLRLGKFNSDIGFWNQIPINVLRDTTSSPRLVSDFFPKLTTGIQYESRQSNEVIKRISFTLQHTHGLDIGYNNMDTDRHYGIVCDIGDQTTAFRFGGGYFRYRPTNEALYLQGSLKLSRKQWDFLFESVLRRDRNVNEIFYDIYGQGLWHLQPKHDFIFRAEVEKTPITGVYDNSINAGYTYRPLNNVALKGEYEAHQDTLLNRILFSVSVLF